MQQYNNHITIRANTNIYLTQEDALTLGLCLSSIRKMCAQKCQNEMMVLLGSLCLEFGSHEFSYPAEN